MNYTSAWNDPRAIYGYDDEDVRSKIKLDLASCECTNYAHLMEMIQQQPIYRIKINKDRSVDTDCYDMLDNFKPELKKFYDSVDNLPEWVQNQVAVLMILDVDKKNNDIEGVGKRISKNVFWIYKKEEQLGDDTRKPS